ncbi:MAG: hypothetical protein CM15mP126_4040 [Gammaproteobacteria bacterium]|nr:MAG: hypothetical protein CM15mP126_4040 [Gammaproteobacteria bacterium]
MFRLVEDIILILIAILTVGAILFELYSIYGNMIITRRSYFYLYM